MPERSHLINPPPDKRPLIALIGDQLADFQKPIVACLNRHFTKAGFGLLYVCGGALKPTAEWNENVPVARTAIFPLSRNFPVAGFVVLTASVGHHANARQIAQFTRLFSHRPVVSYGLSVPRIASVQVDHYTLMSRMMEYMCSNPDRRRFVFIRGYPNNPRSLTQERAFRDALTHRQIPINENLFIDGNFQASLAFQKMDKLLQNTVDIDAVIATNDDMAQAAIHALTSHGLRVPEDVIVSGFYNSLAASTSLPPITTVNCTEDSMAALVTASIQSQLISGEYVGNDSKVLHPPARLIIRASSEPPTNSSAVAVERHIFDAVEFRTALFNSMNNLRTPVGLIVEDIIDDIVSMLVNGTSFDNTHLEAALKGLQRQAGSAYWWRHMHRQITANLEQHGGEGQSSDALSCAAVILGKIHESVWRAESSVSLMQNRFQGTAQRFHSSLMQVSSMNQLSAALDTICEHYNAQSAFICLYEHAGSQPDEFSNVVYQHPRNCLGEVASTTFPSADVLPGKFLSACFSGPLVLEPLCIGQTHLGYLVMDVSCDNFRNQSNITALSDHISNTLWRLLSCSESCQHKT